MTATLEIAKGLHPGILLARELKMRNIPKGSFAMSLDEHPQTIVAITKGKRSMNTSLALKIEEKLGIEEGFFMTLQVYYDIEKIKAKSLQSTPDLSKIRSGLFWDTAVETIDWQRYKRAVIQRVFERGNAKEKAEIERFYGKAVIKEVMNGKS